MLHLSGKGSFGLPLLFGRGTVGKWEMGVTFFPGSILCPVTICNEPNATIADVIVAGELHPFFRRCFDDSMMKRWQMLYDAMLTVSLSKDFDTPIWHLDPSGVYSVQSFYRRVNEGGVHVPHLAAIWKIQIPGCVQVFLWLLAQNQLLTRDNLAKRRVVPDPTCLFCTEPESVFHLFFLLRGCETDLEVV
jgi:hypothetical protein